MLKIGHSVKRPGRKPGDDPITINVPEELETEPGTPQNPREVDFYSREYPLETQNVDLTADVRWSLSQLHGEALEQCKEHTRKSEPIFEAAKTSGDVEPTFDPVPGKDMTEEIRSKAREMGFVEVGFAKLDMRYIYKSRRSWVKFRNAICLAYEQEYEPTQSAPSLEAEGPHYGTYRIMVGVGLEFADYVRSLGYHAQIHSPQDGSGAYIPMFVEAGLGQLGANGQLLSPHFGSRARLMIMTTDAPVTYDHPIDYGMHALCDVCQVCVNRCPGRALMREKVWWRGAQKHKLIYKRCRPVLARYEGCAVCMKVCPVQRYGMKPVMDHYIATGQVLGKGTPLLEGYSIGDKGYFGPGELPHFSTEFFQIPHGKSEDLEFENLKEKIKAGEIGDDEAGDAALREFKGKVDQFVNSRGTSMGYPEDVLDRLKSDV